jgi:TonB family protein
VNELEIEPGFLSLAEQLPPPNWRIAAFVSFALHIVIILILRELPIFEGPARTGPEIQVSRSVTPLYAPVMEPTQKEPNKAKVNREFDVDSLKPRPQVQIPHGPASTTRPAARAPAPVPVPRLNETNPLAEPPRLEAVEAAKNVAPLQLGVPDSPPPPPIPPVEKPKLAFEPVGSGGSQRQGAQGSKVPIPSASVSEAAQAVARSRTAGGLMVGDIGDGIGGLGEGLQLPPSPGRTGSNLELLSDPQGVDFRPYLIRVLAAVRRNWFAVIPESARLGNQRGRVIVQFAIDRSGKVPKLVISIPSGAPPLDRAAVAGISASNPFPPLPGEFKGEQIRLQFTFSYNMANR